jgi:uncharacterized phiE125 gp8 family phage protein
MQAVLPSCLHGNPESLMMNLILITAPTLEPVSVETAKLYLRVDGTADDAEITRLIKSARETCEEISRRAFITQTWDMILDDWPRDLRVRLYRPPLQSVTSVKYLDADNVEHTWTDYLVDARSDPGVIVFFTLPSDSLRESGAIAIRFVSGYGAAAASVPQRVIDAILGLIAYRYENREAPGVPAYIRESMMNERTVWF